MKKKLLALLLALTMALALVACGGNGGGSGNGGGKDADSIDDTMTSSDGKYVIAMVTDVGQLKDKSFNQGTWDGVKLYASQNNKSYKYYAPANGNEATDEDRYNAYISAIDGGAEVIVAPGYLQEAAMKRAAVEHPDVKFVFIDGYPLADDSDNVLSNVVGVAFHEEQCGYLAGYAAIIEGYTKMGFTGGGGGTNPAVNRFGYGFVQGVSAAAAEAGVNAEINFSFLYGQSYSASPELQTQVNGWYANGTEVVFSCGGSMCDSVFAAAAANNGVSIGVDVDQADASNTVMTSAVKGLSEAASLMLGRFYDGKWDEIGGGVLKLGAKDDAVGLPTATCSMKKFSVEDYNKLFESIKGGSTPVDADYEAGLEQAWSNVTLRIV